jgi:hypothetical protein
MPRSIIRTIAIAIAIAALAAPTALARPDASPAVAKPAAAAKHTQDARSPDAIDAATPGKQNLRSPDSIDAATRPALGSQANPRLDVTAQATADPGIAWTTIGIGVAASLLAIGAITGITRRTRRIGRARITA